MTVTRARLVPFFVALAALVSFPVFDVPVSFARGVAGSSECAPRRAARRRPSRPSRSSRSSRSSRGRRSRARPAVSAAYIRTRTAWHRAATAPIRARWAAQEIPPLVIKPVGGARTFELVPARDGTFDTAALEIARDAFRGRAEGEPAQIHPRLLELAYRAVRNFDAPYVHLISGYRDTRATSRHNQGRAMDIVLPGVTDERLAAYLRLQGFVGVGVYPTSGFVHLDVRARSYYWVDRSGPNQPTRAKSTLGHLVSRNDTAARQRNEVPVPDLVVLASEGDEGDSGGE